MRRGLFFAVCLLAFVVSEVGATTPKVRVARYRGDKQCAISYTFDDGLRDQYTLAAPLLEELGWRGTFAINGRKIDVAMIKGDTTRFTWQEAADLARRGHEISNHGWEHKKMTRLTEERIKQEIALNDSAILHNVGRYPLSFCYPYNSKDSLIRRMAEQGRVTSRMYQIAIGKASSAQKMTRWVDRTIRDGSWGIGMTHGILTGYDAFNDFADFENHLLYTKSHEDKIWVAPLAEVAAYVTEQNSVVLDTEIKKNQIVVKLHLSLDSELYNEPLTLVIEGVKRVKKAQQGGRKLDVEACGDVFMVEVNPHGKPVKIKF
ncbi:MAG: polysaccharide deacetylase family protein [Tidjanibacter sp.]|nr:polysaccharide deacetylase family protein [Tidjanibacter sp.]